MKQLFKNNSKLTQEILGQKFEIVKNEIQKQIKEKVNEIKGSVSEDIEKLKNNSEANIKREIKLRDIKDVLQGIKNKLIKKKELHKYSIIGVIENNPKNISLYYRALVKSIISRRAINTSEIFREYHINIIKLDLPLLIYDKKHYLTLKNQIFNLDENYNWLNNSYREELLKVLGDIFKQFIKKNPLKLTPLINLEYDAESSEA